MIVKHESEQEVLKGKKAGPMIQNLHTKNEWKYVKETKKKERERIMYKSR